jgi:dolichol-phosphate mannosyltransferase
MPIHTITSTGYVFQVETTYRAVQAGSSVREVPIVFRDRRAGSSKMSLPIALEAAWKVPALRLQSPRQPKTTHQPRSTPRSATERSAA